MDCAIEKATNREEGKPYALAMRGRIAELESAMKQLPQLDIPLRHYFANGLYAREIFIPAGTLLIGKIHKEEHLNIISKGSASVLTEDGVVHITAPFTMVSFPGAKRVIWAHEDTVWTTIHFNPKNEKDLDVLEDQFILPRYEDAITDASNLSGLLEVQEWLG